MLIIYTYSAHKRPLIDITFKLITLKTMIFLFYFEQHKAIWTEAILATIFFSAKLKFYDDEIEFGTISIILEERRCRKTPF